jgi:DNA ligase-1
MDSVTLYGATKGGKFKQWTVHTEGAYVVMTYGAVNGKMQVKKILAKAKNVGRANATTAEQQAISEMNSRAAKQWDKCYRETCEDAANVGRLLPMLASDYTKVGHRINYPCWVSRKLDGVRCITVVDKVKKTVRMISRGGKDYPVPSHLYKDLILLAESTDTWEFDGELYIHGISLQNIVSAVKKPNPLTPRIEYHIFDVPDEEAEWQYRYMDLEAMQVWKLANRDKCKQIKIVMNEVAENESHAREFMNEWIEDGYEGIMLRNRTGMYESNHRSGTLQKWKDFQDLEAKVLRVTEDNIGEGVLHVRSAEGAEFKCKMRGNHEYRSFENQNSLIDQWINVRFQQFTDDNIPQFPVGTGVRACTPEGVPLD